MLKRRTQAFAIEVLRLVDRLTPTHAVHAAGRQLARSGTSIRANYRAVCNARSRAAFTARLGIVVDEAEETVYWVDVLIESKTTAAEHLAALRKLRAEACELLAIFAKSLSTVRANTAAKRIRR